MKKKILKMAALSMALILSLSFAGAAGRADWQQAGLITAYAGEGLADCGSNLSTEIGGGVLSLYIIVKDKSKSNPEDRSMYSYSGASFFPWHSSRPDIKKVVIRSGVYAISRYAFQDMTSLETVYIPRSVKEIQDDAFAGCTKLSSVYYSGT